MPQLIDTQGNPITTVHKAENAVTSDMLVNPSVQNHYLNNTEDNRRGYNIYYFSELQGITGHIKNGQMMSGTVERPLFGLSIEDRLDIFKRCDIIFGIVTSRMNKISALEWQIENKSKIEDRIVDGLKRNYQIYKEYAGSMNIADAVIRMKMFQAAQRELPDLKMDMSNFQTALLRWRKDIKNETTDKCEEITDWLNEPNIEDTFANFVKKWVFDLMIHGAFCSYKEFVDARLENMYGLPGGSVTPLKGKYVGGGRAYLQMIQGMNGKIYFEDEISYCNYIPSTGISYGHVPLEALVNKIAESLLFDQLMAERADGTKPPEKAVIFGGKLPFGEFTTEEQYSVPIPAEEQKRIETSLNEPRKNAIRTLTGTGTPLVLDLSKADTIAYQEERQELILKHAALVFGTTNDEVNLTGSDNTSGRSTSESQERIGREKGIYPLMQIIEGTLNTEMLPLRYGHNFKFSYKEGLSDDERLDIETKKIESQSYSINEVRLERGDDPFDGEQFDVPTGQQKQSPDGSEKNPMNVKALDA
jgi:phage portal protein BeeE